jgi:hypothetical protein
MFRRWFFWLPVAYLLILGACYLDMQFHLSGEGEANAGAWIYILFMLPSMYVSHALGYGEGSRRTSFLQLLCSPSDWR